jgi:hypothetical protein
MDLIRLHVNTLTGLIALKGPPGLTDTANLTQLIGLLQLVLLRH